MYNVVDVFFFRFLSLILCSLKASKMYCIVGNFRQCYPRIFYLNSKYNLVEKYELSLTILLIIDNSFPAYFLIMLLSFHRFPEKPSWENPPDKIKFHMVI